MDERLQIAVLTAAALVAIAGVIKIVEVVAWFIQVLTGGVV